MNRIPNRVDLQFDDDAQNAQDFVTFTRGESGRLGQPRQTSRPRVIVPRFRREDLHPRTAKALVNSAHRLISAAYPPSQGNPFQTHRLRHVQLASSSDTSYFPIHVRKGPFQRLHKRIKKLRKKLEARINFIAQVEVSDMSFRELSQRTGMTPSKIKKALEAITDHENSLDTSIKHQLRMVHLAKLMDSIFHGRTEAVSSANMLLTELRSLQPQHDYTKQEVYRVLHLMGIRHKKNVPRTYEIATVKEYRKWFLKDFIRILERPTVHLFYFDCTSFSAGNFQQKSWAVAGRKAVVGDVYVYKKLHMLAVLSHEGVKATQWVSGGLSSKIIFQFMLAFLREVQPDVRRRNGQAWLVLDNAPVNRSRALQTAALQFGFSILFTAPNSSFLNPIEYLFAKAKVPLKSALGASELNKK